jgi:3-deoxy-7-phosphoheptulonate synthase
METSLTAWHPGSWREKQALQQPDWPDPLELTLVTKELASYPPLVFAGEARNLNNQLANVYKGQGFVLQAGDCSESFKELSADQIRDKLKVILQMAIVLTYGAGVPVVKMGRIAGQFAKPRSNDFEEINGVKLPSFRGHMVNDDETTLEARIPDPKRLLRAYHHSASTLNLIRAFTKGGFADLSQVHSWNQIFVASSEEGQRYEQLASEIDRALKFMKACGIDINAEATLHQVDFYTAHEALILDYEEPLTRIDSLTGKYYACSAHFLWAGERTRQPNGAHVEFLSGVNNPVGVKLGPKTTEEEVKALAQKLNPERLPGRLSFISRIGKDNIEKVLPNLVKTVQKTSIPVVWICDPMHGNTFVSKQGLKTRRFDDILTEVKKFFDIMSSSNTWPGGIHVELTGGDVTECIGGEPDTLEDHLETNYLSTCDPRLNARQSIDLAFRVAEMLKELV